MGVASDYGLVLGGVYSSRKGSRSPDRKIIYISPSGFQLQYDGDAVRWGQHFPQTTADAFAKWAGIKAKEPTPTTNFDM